MSLSVFLLHIQFMFLFIYSLIYSGEDSIHEGTTAENAHALNWRDGHLNYGTRVRLSACISLY